MIFKKIEMWILILFACKITVWINVKIVSVSWVLLRNRVSITSIKSIFTLDENIFETHITSITRHAFKFDYKFDMHFIFTYFALDLVENMLSLSLFLYILDARFGFYKFLKDYANILYFISKRIKRHKL